MADRPDILGGLPLPGCPFSTSSLPSAPDRSTLFVVHRPVTSAAQLVLAIATAGFALFTALRLNSVTLFSRLIENKTLRNGYAAAFFLCIAAAAFIDTARYSTGIVVARDGDGGGLAPVMLWLLSLLFGVNGDPDADPDDPIGDPGQDPPERRAPAVSFRAVDGVLLMTSSCLRAAAALYLALSLNHQLKWRCVPPPDANEAVTGIEQPESSPRFLTYFVSPDRVPPAAGTRAPQEVDALLPPTTLGTSYGSTYPSGISGDGSPMWDDDDDEEPPLDMRSCCTQLRSGAERFARDYIVDGLFSRKGLLLLLFLFDVGAAFASAASRPDRVPREGADLFLGLQIAARSLLQLPVLLMTLAVMLAPRTVVSHQARPGEPAPRKMRYGPNRRAKLLLALGVGAFVLCGALEPSWISRALNSAGANPCPVPPYLWREDGQLRGWASFSDCGVLLLAAGCACTFGFVVREHRRSRTYLRFVAEDWLSRTFDFRRF
ncbi:hypothetical protein DFJ74DRAFT_712732 [Hyaloraphidium curvatum]|nr:hypothetical protein DFJ74DRAFT_712732 [Hyaloraphidium curvatum]